MLLLAIITLISMGLLAHYKRFYALFALSLVVAYETSVPLVYLYGDNNAYLGLSYIVNGIDDAIIEGQLSITSIFIVFFMLGIAASTSKAKTAPAIDPYTMNNIITITGILIFIIGSISLLNGGGYARVAQYVRDSETTVTPFHYYAIALSPMAWFFTVKAYFSNQYKHFIYLLAASAPAMIDLFIAGRRQMFVPLIFFIIFFTVTQKNITRTKIFTHAMLITLAGAGIFALQFSFRFDAASGITNTENYIERREGGILLPQIIELTFSGGTSTSAIRDFIQTTFTNPLGIESWVAFVSQSIPIMGNAIYTTLASDTTLQHFMLSDIAPNGALTILAEGVVFFGLYGAIFYGLLTGYICGILDFVTRQSTNWSTFNNPTHIAKFCIAAIVLFKYRSGFTDALQNAAFTTLLLLLIYKAATTLTNLRRSLRKK